MTVKEVHTSPRNSFTLFERVESGTRLVQSVVRCQTSVVCSFYCAAKHGLSNPGDISALTRDHCCKHHSLKGSEHIKSH